MGLSRYAYVQGNPETHVDADGHCWPLCTMLIGAVVGAAIGAGTSIVSQAASGKGVDWGEVGKQAAVGAVAGAISGLAGPEAGPPARAAIDTAASVGGQVLSNAMEHKPLGDGVGTAAATGALSSIGMGVAGGLLAKGAGRFFGSVAKDAEGEVADGVEQVAQCALSFSADTLVATPDGQQPIASVKPGDAVTAYDPSTGTASSQTVTATTIHHDDNLVDVTLQVTTPASQQSTTATAGQASTSSSGAQPAATSAATLQTRGSHQEVVHTTTNHPWLTADHGWLPAGFLQVGEAVQRADGTTATVVAIHAVPGATPMWDLTVANVHTFAVGVGAYVVHNCGASNPYSGNVVEHPAPKVDPAADKLAARIGGRAHVMFDGDPQAREFDAISDRFVAQAKPALRTLGSQFRRQARATFEAALDSGRTPYFQFEGTPARAILSKLGEYEAEYGIKPIIDTNPLGP